jgi:hypothetical protein
VWFASGGPHYISKLPREVIRSNDFITTYYFPESYVLVVIEPPNVVIGSNVFVVIGSNV